MTTMIPRPRAVLIDLSGTLHIDHIATRGARDALARLRAAEHNIAVRFVTNTTKESTDALLAQLNGACGLDVRRSELFSSLSAARRYIDANDLRPMLLLHDGAMADFEGVGAGGDSRPDSVVVGLAPEKFNYATLGEAMRVLLDSGENGRLVAIHRGRYFMSGCGKLEMGPGPFVAALEDATKKKAVVVGKPESAFFKLALDDANVRPEDAIMIGDDVRDDIGGAMALGMRGILVRTGKYRPGDEASLQGVIPTAVVDDFASAVDLIVGPLQNQ